MNGASVYCVRAGADCCRCCMQYLSLAEINLHMIRVIYSSRNGTFLVRSHRIFFIILICI